MNKEENTLEILLSNLIIRVTCLEKMLIDKGVLDQDELAKNIYDLTVLVARNVMKNTPGSEELEDLIKNINKQVH